MTNDSYESRKIIRKPPPGFHLELMKDKKTYPCVVCGVILVSLLTEKEILLSTHGGRLRIFGDKLSLSTFSERSVEVRGRIEGVEILYGKN